MVILIYWLIEDIIIFLHNYYMVFNDMPILGPYHVNLAGLFMLKTIDFIPLQIYF